MNIKRFFSNWQGFTALLAALAVFWFSPHLLHWLDPTAGTFDVGYLQRPLVAAAYFFFATFCAWTAFQIEFPTLNRWLDMNGFAESWKLAPAEFKLRYTLSALALLVASYLVCLWLVPV